VPEFEHGFLAQLTDEPLVKMMQQEPTMTVEDMQRIACPALIMSGEHDLILADHTRLIGENIPDGRVKILPDEDHGSYICNSPKLAPLMLEFFKEIGY
jgi:pimeloyl-ACP methyl ester carboxylesterase